MYFKITDTAISIQQFETFEGTQKLQSVPSLWEVLIAGLNYPSTDTVKSVTAHCFIRGLQIKARLITAKFRIKIHQ